MGDLQVPYLQGSAGILFDRDSVGAFRMAAAGRGYARVDSLDSNLAGMAAVYRKNLYQGIDLTLPLNPKIEATPRRHGK